MVAAEPEAEASLEPAPTGRAKKPKKTKAAAAATTEGGEDEEIPDWKRKLLELTDEEGEGS